jgi:tetratricopeptide (TPR) repeat protein
LTHTEHPEYLLIRAKQAYDKVAADPERYRHESELLVAEARRARDPEALALALRALAWAERARLRQTEAIRLLAEAARIARRRRYHEILAEVLITHAAVSQELGRISTAHRNLRAAAALVDPARLPELDFNRAVLLQNTGHLGEAVAIYQRLLPGTGLSPRRQVQVPNNLALIEAEQGRYTAALSRLDQALPLAREVGPHLVAHVIHSRAWVAVQSGRFVEGLANFDSALHEYQAAGLPLGEHYIDYADGLMELRLLPEAADAARRAVEELSAAGTAMMAADAQLKVAQLALLSGNTGEALEASAAAADAYRRQARATGRARSLLVTAEARLAAGGLTPEDLAAARGAARRLAAAGVTSSAVQGYLVTGRLAAALGLRRQAITALTRAGTLARGAPVLVRLRGRLASALAAVLAQRPAEALASCRRGLADLARHRGSLPSVELRALASGHGAELGRIGLNIVISGGSPARVLHWMERSRAAALLAVEPPKFEDISADLSALRAAAAAGGTGAGPGGGMPGGPGGPGGPNGARAGRVTAEQAQIESRIRQVTWRAGGTVGSAGGPVTVGALRELLAGRVLVTYGTLADDLVAVVIGERGSRLVPLGPAAPVREQLRAFLFALRRLAEQHGNRPLDAARASADLRIKNLSALLIEPLRVTGVAELVVVPVPDLLGVPWSALYPGPVSLAPSATFWARSALAVQAMRATSPDRGEGVALIAGPDLPGALAEVGALAGIYPRALSLAPPDSTAERVTAALATADLAHLACHGALRADNPMFSSLLLSDGPLTVQELYARGLAPHRLILASCESGAQVSYAGDEVLGFVSALLARGTAGVLASTAVVPDVASTGFMTAVHEQLARGDSLAVALHTARASLDIGDPATFVNWCTFSAHGAA